MRVDFRDVVVQSVVVVILLTIAVGFGMEVQQSVKEITCARAGYPIARRVSLTQVACFTVENGATVKKN